MNKVTILIAKTLFAWLALASLAHAAEPVAMITDLKGAAHLSGQSKPLALLSYLPAGDEIVLENGTLVITYFDQSSEFTFKGPSHILIKEKAATVSKGASLRPR